MARPMLFDLEWFAALIEFGGGVLLTLGLFSRPAAFIMSGEMAIGYFLFRARRLLSICQQGRSGGAVLFRVFVSGVAGPGPWS